MDTHESGGGGRRGYARRDVLAYSVNEAAYLIGVSRRTIYELIAQRRLNSIKLRGRRLITQIALEQLLADAENEL